MDIDALLEEIETENDWPEEATVFKQIEKSLSCAICHGTLKAAVLLSKCGHSFCSYCIRQYLAHDQFCPLCRKPASQSDIIRNITVIEIADTFRENRKALLQLCKQLISPPLPNPSTNQQKEKESINNEEIDEKTIFNHLYTKDLPQLDLLIRTSGEQRLSNYLLWQLAYTEFYFTDVLWPDFNKEELIKAIAYYNGRERRFGGIK